MAAGIRGLSAVSTPVHPSTREITRPGCCKATSRAMTPPMETPYTCARSTPAASITARASPAMSATVTRRVVALSPVPRLSNQITRCSAARASRAGYHMALE